MIAFNRVGYFISSFALAVSAARVSIRGTLGLLLFLLDL